MLRDDLRLEAAVAIAWHLDAYWTVVGDDRLAGRPVAVVGLLGRLRLARRIAEVMAHLAPHGPLDDGLLQRPADRFDLLLGHRTLHHVIQQGRGDV